MDRFSTSKALAMSCNYQLLIQLSRRNPNKTRGAYPGYDGIINYMD